MTERTSKKPQPKACVSQARLPTTPATTSRTREHEHPNAKHPRLDPTSGCSVQRDSSHAERPRSHGGSSARAYRSDFHLELARARAFQAGILPVGQFVDFSYARHGALLPTSSQANPAKVPSMEPPSAFFERLRAAAGKPGPEHVGEILRGEEVKQPKGEGYERRGGRSRKQTASTAVSLSDGNIGNPGEKSDKTDRGRREQEQARHDDEEAEDCQSRRYRRLVFSVLPFSSSSIFFFSFVTP